MLPANIGCRTVCVNGIEGGFSSGSSQKGSLLSTNGSILKSSSLSSQVHSAPGARLGFPGRLTTYVGIFCSIRSSVSNRFCAASSQAVDPKVVVKLFFDPVVGSSSPSIASMTSWKNAVSSILRRSRSWWKCCELTRTDKNRFDLGDRIFCILSGTLLFTSEVGLFSSKSAGACRRNLSRLKTGCNADTKKRHS